MFCLMVIVELVMVCFLFIRDLRPLLSSRLQLSLKANARHNVIILNFLSPIHLSSLGSGSFPSLLQCLMMIPHDHITSNYRQSPLSGFLLLLTYCAIASSFIFLLGKHTLVPLHSETFLTIGNKPNPSITRITCVTLPFPDLTNSSRYVR